MTTISIIDEKRAKTRAYMAARRAQIRPFLKNISVGDTINKIEIIKDLGYVGGKNKSISCKCHCGSIFIVKKQNLISVRSCGCSKNRIASSHAQWIGVGQLSGSVVSKIKSSASKKGFDFNIDIKFLSELFEKQNKKCALSGLEIELPGSNKALRHGLRTASLDRIDSYRGYVVGNVQWVHKDINMMKQRFYQERFIKLCDLVTNRQISNNIAPLSIPKHSAYRGVGELSRSYFCMLKQKAKTRNLAFDVSVDYLWSLFVSQNYSCSLSHQPLVMPRFSKEIYTNKRIISLDRIDSSLGYVETNVQWTHKEINMMKQKFSQIYFLNLCQMITNHQEQLK